MLALYEHDVQAGKRTDVPDPIVTALVQVGECVMAMIRVALAHNGALDRYDLVMRLASEQDAEAWKRHRATCATCGGHVVSQRFRVTVGVPATATAPKRDPTTTYYVYGRTREEALRRLPAELLIDAKVEVAGCVVDGVLHLPDDEKRPVIIDDRVTPGAPGPAR